VQEAAPRLYADQHGLCVICLRIGTVLRVDRPSNARHFATLLTHRDLVHLVECCVETEEALRFGVFYGVSANTWGSGTRLPPGRRSDTSRRTTQSASGMRSGTTPRIFETRSIGGRSPDAPRYWLRSLGGCAGDQSGYHLSESDLEDF
jgi:hypothetical protein